MKMDQYPEICECVPSTSEIVRLLRGHPGAELEARFGKVLPGKFHPGTSRETMDVIIDMLKISSYVQGEEEWKEEQDYYYSHEGRQLRTRVLYDSNLMMINSHTTEKKLIKSSTFRNVRGDDKAYDLRVSLKTEEEVVPPASCNPTLVRIKQHRRFVTENKLWAFDFSMTWSGKTKTEAETSQINDDPFFEIECELLDANVLNTRSNESIATSLLLKMYDLVLPEKTKYVPC